MGSTAYSRRFPFYGLDPSLDVEFTAVTARETPQALLSWKTISAVMGGFRVVRNQFHYPRDVDDGFLVYESERSPDVEGFGDTIQLPDTFYYYRVFGYLAGTWIALGSDWAMSGGAQKLELASPRTTVADGWAVETGATRIPVAENGDETGEFFVGQWIRIGKKPPFLYRPILKITPSDFKNPVFLYVEDVGVVPDEPIPEVRHVKLTFRKNDARYLSRSTIERETGSFLKDGFREKTLVTVFGSSRNNKQAAVSFPVADDRILQFTAATFLDETNLGYAVLQPPRGKIAGEPVIGMKMRGPILARRFYDRYISDSMREDDAEIAAQGRDLVEEALASGEKVNLQSPGVQYGYERWVRWLLMDLNRVLSAIRILPDLYDLDRSPTEFLRIFSKRYNYEIPQDADAARLRLLVRMQPYFKQLRGRDDLLRTWIEVLTGQVPKEVLGRDRVVRFNELHNGFAEMGKGFPTALPAENILRDTFATWQTDLLKGFRLQSDVDVAYYFPILGNTPTDLVLDISDGFQIGQKTTFVEGALEGGQATHSAVGLTFNRASTPTASGFDEIVWSGDYIAAGYGTSQYVYVYSATNGANNGLHRVTTIPTTHRLVLDSVNALAAEVSAKAWLRGGLTEKMLFDHVHLDAFSADDPLLVGKWAMPLRTDNGFDGRPRPFQILHNSPLTHSVTTQGNHLSTGAAPGGLYRITSQYRIVAPYGGARDSRKSIYTARKGSVFNDKGLLLYLENAITSAEEDEVRQLLKDLRRATVTVLLFAGPNQVAYLQ